MGISNEVKTAIRNTLINFSDNDIAFTPQAFLDILCDECRELGVNVSDGDWFIKWSAQFDDEIKAELAAMSAKTRDAFIAKIAQILQKRENERREIAQNALQKALAILKAKNIIDFSENLPLNAIDSKLGAILNESLAKTQTAQSANQTSDFFANIKAQKIPPTKEILLCLFSEKAFIKKMDSAAQNKLLSAFCAILIKNLDGKNVIGIYKNAIAIFSKSPINALRSEIESILQTSTFMLQNKPLRLEIDFKVVPFGELK